MMCVVKRMQGVLFPLVLNGLLCAGCMSLAIRGFSEGGLPLSKSKRLVGYPAKLAGVACALLGLLFLAACGIGIWWGVAEVH